ncbi:MAG: hypothetical protein FWD53_02560 [Phycisphaerales bacterium]|nr:hypothetical protein [Phycisphaerales bacterium]
MNLPIDERLDLLVDEELPEQQRRELLLWLDANPRRWRDLSIRFLQRQVENKAIGELLAVKTGAKASVDLRSTAKRGGTGRYVAMAAGLLGMVVSALVVVYFVGRPGGGPEVITASLPGSLWDVKGTQNVRVPVTTSDVPVLFPTNASHQAQRRTIVITPEGSHNALIIPVTNLQYQ